MRHHGDALSAAAYLDNKEIVQDLLDAGATLDGNDYGYHGAPIIATATEGPYISCGALHESGCKSR
jgi:hypothetical protein